jgi:hypothetical protein
MTHPRPSDAPHDAPHDAPGDAPCDAPRDSPLVHPGLAHGVSHVKLLRHFLAQLRRSTVPRHHYVPCKLKLNFLQLIGPSTSLQTENEYV